MKKPFPVLFFLALSFTAAGVFADGPIINLNVNYQRPAPITLKKADFSKPVDPRITFPIALSVTGTILGAAAGFGAGYLRKTDDKILSGLVAMSVGIPIGLTCGAAVGIFTGIRQHRIMTTIEKDSE